MFRSFQIIIRSHLGPVEYTPHDDDDDDDGDDNIYLFRLVFHPLALAG